MSSANAEPTPINDRVAPDGNSARTAFPPPTFCEKVEAWLSRTSMKSNLLQKAFSYIWLPYAFRSGLTMKRVDQQQFVAVLPFRRFNRNWYNAMAGAALLGNSEVAGGMYLFGECGGDYVVVCKEMKYRFLRPCLGPAVYRVVNSDDVRALIKAGGEFNVNLVMEVAQLVGGKDGDRKVGQCDITFHCTPKSMIKAKANRLKALESARAARDAAASG
jgi:acyl-coenzyme A thioesterase PaaI-like protein